jgi:hypothetical protein
MAAFLFSSSQQYEAFFACLLALIPYLLSQPLLTLLPSQIIDPCFSYKLFLNLYYCFCSCLYTFEEGLVFLCYKHHLW